MLNFDFDFDFDPLNTSKNYSGGSIIQTSETEKNDMCLQVFGFRHAVFLGFQCCFKDTRTSPRETRGRNERHTQKRAGDVLCFGMSEEWI